MIIKLSWEKIYLYTIFAWSLFNTLFNESLLGESWNFIYIWVWKFLKIVLVIKILLGNKRTFKDIFKLLICISIAILSTYFSKSFFLESFFWFIIAAENVDIRKAVKMIFKAQLIAIVFILLLTISGLIENRIFYRDGSATLRYAMGFTHPNMFSVKIFQIISMYIYLKKERLKFINLIIILFITMCVYILTNSQTFLILSLSLVILSIIYLLICKKIKLISNIACYLIKYLKYFLPLLLVLSFYITLTYDNKYFPFSKNNTMYSRFIQMNNYYEYYDLTLFGQPLFYHNNNETLSFLGRELYTLDNAYMYLFLGFGILVFLIIILGYIFIIIKTIKNKQYIELIIISLYAIMGFSETSLIRFSLNFTLLFFISMLWTPKSTITNKSIDFVMKTGIKD